MGKVLRTTSLAMAQNNRIGKISGTILGTILGTIVGTLLGTLLETILGTVYINSER